MPNYTWLHDKIIGYYTRAEIEPIIEAANGRQDFAETTGLVNYGRKDLTPAQIRANHGIGTVGEWFVAGAYQLKFDPSIGKIDQVDLKIIEVRARRIESDNPTPDLTIRPKDHARLPYVLARIDLDRLYGEIPGWLCAWEAWERPNKPWFELGEVWFVSPPYHSPLSLKQWIDQGHPLHWCPEKYRQGVPAIPSSAG